MGAQNARQGRMSHYSVCISSRGVAMKIGAIIKGNVPRK